MLNDEMTPTTVSAETSPVMRYLCDLWHAVDGNPEQLTHLAVTGSGSLVSAFAVSEFATATVGTASLAMGELISTMSGKWPAVQVDRRLASFWFGTSLCPQGWTLPPLWDAVAGDYLAADGWIRLHTNAPHHREAALAVLGTEAQRDAVARAVSRWKVDELETAIVERNGCAAAMRSAQAWAEHPQGRSVGEEPLLHRRVWLDSVATPSWRVSEARPLEGIRVLDLTRILAGPVATRFLAGFGAEVLRIDPYGWEEPGTVPEVVLGKRCARLDLKNPADLATLERLIGEADVMVHGYRADALAHLGLDGERRRELNPALIDISLDAYGWSGPWRERRGFDSLIQMSTGIAEAGMRAAGAERPVPLPVQAIDHGTGYLLAAAAIRGITRRLSTGAGYTAQASLARTAKLLIAHSPSQEGTAALTPEAPDDLATPIENTSWGPARRLKSPVSIEGAPMFWSHPASALGSAPAAWSSAA